MSKEPILKNFSSEEKREIPIPQETRPLTIMSENDAYIAERMKEQPKTLSEISVVSNEEKNGIHRLSLPDYFEGMSYDCSLGVSCQHHGWAKSEVNYGLDMKMDRWNQTKHGKFVFRWLNKNKRALDHNMNVRGWLLANRTIFVDAPKILFSVSGAVENGDSILAFMPVSKALSMREKPSKDSQDRINSEEKRFEGHPNFYKAKLSSDKEGVDDAPVDALQEGRDFNV